MPGGGPQGTLLGVLEYLVQCNNNADCVDETLRFKYVNDLTFLELISLSTMVSLPTTLKIMYPVI